MGVMKLKQAKTVTLLLLSNQENQDRNFFLQKETLSCGTYVHVVCVLNLSLGYLHF